MSKFDVIRITGFIDDGDELRALKDFVSCIEREDISVEETGEILKHYDESLFNMWEEDGRDIKWLINFLKTWRLKGMRGPFRLR